MIYKSNTPFILHYLIFLISMQVHIEEYIFLPNIHFFSKKKTTSLETLLFTNLERYLFANNLC